jgi:hypothetical protein
VRECGSVEALVQQFRKTALDAKGSLRDLLRAAIIQPGKTTREGSPLDFSERLRKEYASRKDDVLKALLTVRDDLNTELRRTIQDLIRKGA